MSIPRDPLQKIPKPFHQRAYTSRQQAAGAKGDDEHEPVHEDVAVAGEGLTAEEAGLQKVALRQPSRSRSRASSSSSRREHQLVLHAGADQPRPRRRRRAAPAEGERAVPAAPTPTPAPAPAHATGTPSPAAGPARRAAEAEVHRRRRRRRGARAWIHLRDAIRPGPVRWLARSCPRDGARRRGEGGVLFRCVFKGGTRGGGGFMKSAERVVGGSTAGPVSGPQAGVG
jgi:hypothetical protein